MRKPAHSLTGATRYRSGWLGGLILQVEERYIVRYDGRPGFDRRPDPNPISTPVYATRWRDARTVDLMGNVTITTAKLETGSNSA